MQGVQAHPQKFWFSENPRTIHGNLWKSSQNPWKAKMVLDMLWFEKVVLKMIWRCFLGVFFGGHFLVWFFGQVWGNLGKICKTFAKSINTSKTDGWCASIWQKWPPTWCDDIPEIIFCMTFQASLGKFQ